MRACPLHVFLLDLFEVVLGLWKSHKDEAGSLVPCHLGRWSRRGARLTSFSKCVVQAPTATSVCDGLCLPLVLDRLTVGSARWGSSESPSDTSPWLSHTSLGRQQKALCPAWHTAPWGCCPGCAARSRLAVTVAADGGVLAGSRAETPSDSANILLLLRALPAHLCICWWVLPDSVTGTLSS